MRITEKQLRQIIREELARGMNEMDLPLSVPFISGGHRKKKKALEPRIAPKGPMPDSLKRTYDNRTALQNLVRDLSKVDEDYVKSIITAQDKHGEYLRVADWAGEELKKKIEEFAANYMRTAGKDPEETFEEFEELVNQYSPIRARKDFLGTATRLASNLGLGTKTKE